ncbi:AAA family ATPase [Hydrogenophaga sp. 2FB]|uniref:AAA family ATPase n=1 Tax=Hydrogenophaga sp. 2FB TaxID=2502187 RepID=UPI0010FA14A7|nr:AAA family ATPase [Hydrogenophaga sp. 2FB]
MSQHPFTEDAEATSPENADQRHLVNREARASLVTDSQFVEQSIPAGHRAFKHVLVTQTLKDELDAEILREAERKKTEEAEAEKARLEEACAQAVVLGAEGGEQAKEEFSRAQRKGIIIGKAEPEAFCEQLKSLPIKRKFQVYEPSAIEKLRESKGHSDADVRKRNEAIFKELQFKGAWRRVDWPRHLDVVLALEQSHPHFSEVIHFVADRMALAKVSRRAVRIPPMLLAGPPGVGKTHFCEALAKVLNVPVRRHPMDQAETSSALLGSEITWGNTRIGLVFEMLAHGDHANPLVILDELDKARGFGRSADPTAVLHSLLEPVSASKVRDQSVEIELDASLITWIATCNYPWLIAPTLRSRMREFFIRMPDAEQAIQVARAVVAAATRDAGVRLERAPDKAFVLALAHLSAREIYQLTGSVIAQAVRQGRGAVSLDDLPVEVLGDDVSSAQRLRLH